MLKIVLPPALYVVPTPLGNRADLSARAISVLASVHFVAAEDTRHSGLLLQEINPTVSWIRADQHQENAAADRIIEKIAAGDAVALVSDAGTPCISDPGAKIVAAVHQAGFQVVPLPGPCAITTALSASGFAHPHFFFYGFLPSKSGERQAAIRSLQHQNATLVFYEAPHRVLETLADLALILIDSGDKTDRELVIAREITKRFESIHKCLLSEGAAWLSADENRQRGEFVLLVSAPPKPDHSIEGERVLRLLIDDGFSLKQASQLAAKISGASKNHLYAVALSWKKTDAAKE